MTFAVGSERGLVHHDLQQGGMTGGKFSDFSTATTSKARNIVYLFDNAICHNSANSFSFDSDF